jgi:hypothetical protein
MAAERAMPVEEVSRSRVEFVSDDGTVVLVAPDGQRRAATVPPNLVSLIRRLAAISRERDQR